MSRAEWAGIAALLNSEKIKDRNEGMSAVRPYLSSKARFNSLTRDSKFSWTDALQDLFGLVKTEWSLLTTAKKTSLAATEKRLEEASELACWLIEKVIDLLPKIGIKSVYNHLTQFIAAARTKQEPYLASYSKALKNFLTRHEHVEHIKANKWAEVVMLCFSVVLGDKLPKGQDISMMEDRAMEVGESDDEDGDTRSTRRKRLKRTVESDDELDFNSTSSSRRSASATEIHLVGCIEALFRSRSAPFASNARVIFIKFTRFFRQFPNETTAHYPALTALNRAFAELDVNDQARMRKLGVKLWSSILSLWMTKHAPLKEQVLMALRHLFPFALHHLRASGPTQSPAVTRVRALYDAIMTEPKISWRDAYVLNLDHLRLGASTREVISRQPRPFELATIRLGHEFSDKEAIAWALLELGADTLASIHDVNSGNDVAEEPSGPMGTPSRNGKRRKVSLPISSSYSEAMLKQMHLQILKVDEPLSLLIDSLEDSTEPATVLAFQVQFVLFFVERHSGLLRPDVHRRCVLALTNLASHSDQNVQSWSFVALGALASIELDGEPRVPRTSPAKRKTNTVGSLWEPVWTLAMRRLVDPELGRSTAHTANMILAYDRLPPSVIASTIEYLARDLEVGGPSFPCDSVCRFLEWCLAISSADVRLYRLGLRDRVLTWVITTWSPLDGLYCAHGFGQSRPRSDPFSPPSLMSLIARLCGGIEEVPELLDQVVIPDCPIATMAIEHCETAPIRDYIDSKVPPLPSEAQALRARTPSSLSARGASSSDHKFRAERRVSTWLQKALSELVNEGRRADSDKHWDLMPVETARRHLELACVALNIEGLFSLTKSIKMNKATIKVATEVLVQLAPSFGNIKWKPDQRSLLLSTLDSILIPLDEYAAVEYPVFLDPGLSSGIASHLIPDKKTRREKIDFNSFEMRLLKEIWSDPNVRAALAEIASVLAYVVSGMSPIDDNEMNADDGSPTQSSSTQAFPSTQASQRLKGIARTQREDDFGDVKVASKSNQLAADTTAARASAACVRECVRGLVSTGVATSGVNGPVRVNELVEAIISSPGEQAIIVAEQTLNAVRQGIIDFGYSQAEQVLDHLGNELLLDYRFERNERFALLGIRFLECTAPLWILPPDSAKQAGENLASSARELTAWYTGNLHRGTLPMWRVRVRLLVFLDLYISLDRRQSEWNLGEHATKAADGEPILPTAIIPHMLADEDFRVRFRAATSAAALFDFMFENDFPAAELFNDIKDSINTNHSEREYKMTEILALANVIIMDASRRRSPYPFIIDLTVALPELIPCATVTLEGAARCMGLEGLRHLYELYAQYCAFQIYRQNAYGTLSAFPYQLAGYSSLRDLRKADYRQVGSILLKFDNAVAAEVFQSMCGVLQRPRNEVTLDCFAETAALLIAYQAVEKLAFSSAGSVTMDPVYDRMRSLVASPQFGDDHQVTKFITSISDEVVAGIFAHLYEELWTDEFVDAVLGTVDRKACVALKEMLAMSDAGSGFVEATPPHFTLAQVVEAVRWVDKTFQTLTSVALFFFVVQDLLVRIHRAPFIDTQKNHLVALSLALALGRRAARDPSVLDAVTDGLTSLLTRVELTSSVAGTLQWCFQQWIDSSTSVKSFGSSLCANALRAAQACEDVLHNKTASEEATLAALDLASILRRIPEKLEELRERVVDEAYLLWPTPLVGLDKMPFESIARVLADSRSSVNKFSIVEALQNRVDFESSPLRHVILWRLMQTMKSGVVPTLEQSSALAELLARCSGEAERPALDRLAPVDQVDSEEHVIEDDSGIKELLTGRLLRLTKTHAERPIELVQQSLAIARLICSVPSGAPVIAMQSLATPHSKLVAILSHDKVIQPHRLRSRESRNLTELSSEDWIRLSERYDDWVKNLSAFLADVRAADEPYYAQLPPLLSIDVDFAADSLPALIHSILLRGVQSGDTSPGQMLSTYLERILTTHTADLRCLGLIVETATYLRIHPRPDLGALSLARCDKWLNIPWILLAEGAVKSGGYSTSLLFLELGHEYDQLFQHARDHPNRSLDALDARGQALLYDIYAEIDEPDGFYGRQSSDVRAALSKRYHHEARWNEAFGLHGADFEAASNSRSKASASGGVVNSLSSFGFNKLALSMMNSVATEGLHTDTNNSPTDLSYSLAWKTDTWDLPVASKSSSTISQASLYSALRSVYTGRDLATIEATASNALIREVSKLSSVSLDLPRPPLQTVSTILALQDIRNVMSTKKAHRPALIRAQEGQMINRAFSFTNAEQILSTRISLLRAIKKEEDLDSFGDEFRSAIWRDACTAERTCLLELSAISRQDHHLQASMNAVTAASQLCDQEDESVDVDEELAMVLWAQPDHSTAITLLESVRSRKTSKIAIIAATLGEWSAAARLRNSREIIENYYRPATASLDDGMYTSIEQSRVYHSFAEFADQQFQHMNEAIKERRERFNKYQQLKSVEIDHIDQRLQGGESISGGIDSYELNHAKKEALESREEDQRLFAEASTALADMHFLALENYAASLARSDEYDDDVLRFCALWLAFSHDEVLNRKLEPLLKRIASHKFVFLSYQLSARLVHLPTPTSFSRNISSLVVRLCTDHPFHCLYPVNTLRELASTLSPTNSGRSRRSSTISSAHEQRANTSRAKAAEEVFDKVKRVPSLRIKADAITLACDAYRDWAEFRLQSTSTYWNQIRGSKTGKVKPGTLPMLETAPIMTKVVDLPIPVTTFDLPVDPTCRYDESSWPRLLRYGPTFTTAGGINLPKIVVCIGSDGREYRQLLKGNDDIRQDAVMEQLFVLVNRLLARDTATRQRKLIIRTYKVVPLQNSTGLIEFVANTEPLKSVLDPFYERLKKRGDTSKLIPREAVQPLSAIRAKCTDDRDTVAVMNRKLEAKFRELLPKVPPMMRHVFMQKHTIPSLWFDTRLNYSRSVATTSIVGHIIGLGDRHCSNILMDKVRGEIISIDLGIAFDQGKRLRIPETIPFRLTQNIVDGFGMSGVDGVFRRCCEETLRVLRSRSNVLVTVLEVFKHDPLQKWAISAELAKRIQDSEGDADAVESLPDDADRALAIVASKLDDRLNVASTVNALIQEATNPANLAVVFVGWQPFV